MTPTNEAGHGLPELPVPWSDYWASKGNWALSHNYAAFELADEWLRANLDALALSRGVPESGRYFVNGPQGSFFTSDKTFADLFVREVDDPDDWTITDLSNPTGTAPAAAGAQGEECAASVSERARELLAAECGVSAGMVNKYQDRNVIARVALLAIEKALTQQQTAAAKHWHGLYRKECRLRQDDAARYGQQIVDLEAALSSHRQAGDALSKFRELAVTDEMVERACKKYAFREDGAIWPDAYSEHEVTAERALMREFLEHVLALVEKGAGS